MSATELSLPEMRMLVSSAIHLDVSQIALCVITIPKLKVAIQDLLSASALLGVSKSRSRPRRMQSEMNGMSQKSFSTGTGSDYEEMDVHSDMRMNPVAVVPHTQPMVEPEPVAAPPVSIPMDALLVESNRSGTEFSMVGDKIAIGRPGKSKAKTDKRVRYITCRVCHLLFYKRDQYREHMRIHANDPNINIYSCDKCTFVTKRRGVFNTHKLRHTGDLPFKCRLCDYAGRQASLLKQHIINKHPDYDERSSDRDNSLSNHSDTYTNANHAEPNPNVFPNPTILLKEEKEVETFDHVTELLLP